MLALAWIIPFLALFFTSDAASAYSWVLYSAQACAFFVLWHRTGRVETFLSPAALLIIYVGLSFAMGNYAFGRGLVLHQGNYLDSLNWEYLHLSNFYVLTSNVLLYQMDVYFRRRNINRELDERRSISCVGSWILGSISIVFFLIFLVIDFNLEFMGGSGGFSIIPKTISAIIVVALLAYKKIRYRFLVYAAILLLFSFFSYDNKREAVFLILPILFLEAVLSQWKIRLRYYAIGIVLGVGVLSLIIMMSIFRGYGNFNVEGASGFDLVQMIFQYAYMDDFLPMIFNNIETNYTYFHSMQSMEYIWSDPSLLTFGSTIVKVLFIGVPTSMAPWKPDSFIGLYSSLYDPVFRAMGGSWPPNIVAEMFWNFHLAGLLALLVAFAILTIIYHKIVIMIRSGAVIAHIWLLYLYMHILTYARGSGLDLYVVYVVLGAAFGYLYYALLLLFSTRHSGRPETIRTSLPRGGREGL